MRMDVETGQMYISCTVKIFSLSSYFFYVCRNECGSFLANHEIQFSPYYQTYHLI